MQADHLKSTWIFQEFGMMRNLKHVCNLERNPFTCLPSLLLLITELNWTNTSRSLGQSESFCCLMKNCK